MWIFCFCFLLLLLFWWVFFCFVCLLFCCFLFVCNEMKLCFSFMLVSMCFSLLKVWWDLVLLRMSFPQICVCHFIPAIFTFYVLIYSGQETFQDTKGVVRSRNSKRPNHSCLFVTSWNNSVKETICSDNCMINFLIKDIN